MIALDDNIEDHPKFVSLSDDSFSLWIRCIGYCRRNLTDGFVPEQAARSRVRGKRPAPKVIGELLAPPVGLPDSAPLWSAVAGGYQIHDYLDWNPSKAAVEAMREQKRVAGARGGRRSGEVRGEAKGQAGANQTRSTDEAECFVSGPAPSASSERPSDGANAPELWSAKIPARVGLDEKLPETKTEATKASQSLDSVKHGACASASPLPNPDPDPIRIRSGSDPEQQQPRAIPAGSANATVMRIRAKLQSLDHLAELATVDFAQRLAAFTNADGHPGTKSPDDVLADLDAAAQRIADEASVGEHWPRGRLVAFVLGCVKKPVERRREAVAAAEPNPDLDALRQAAKRRLVVNQ